MKKVKLLIILGLIFIYLLSATAIILLGTADNPIMNGAAIGLAFNFGIWHKEISNWYSSLKITNN